MSELIQFDGRTVAIIAPEDLEQMETEVERLQKERDEARAIATRSTFRSERLRQRTHIMRRYLLVYCAGSQSLWQDFLRVNPEAAEWFDEDGVPQ